MSEPLILVKWHDKTGQATRDFAARQHAMKRVPNEHWDKVGIELYQLPPGLAKKSADWLVEKGWAKAEVDGDMLAVPVPNVGGTPQSFQDLISGSTYYQKKVGVPQAWSASTGKVKIGDVDSGANHNHEWLKSSIVASKNFVANEDTVNDNEGHGTATAGIIKAIARDCELVIARVMSQNVCKWSAWGPGVIWCVDQGCVAVNSSIGGPSDSFSILSALAYATERNVVVLCAAGNAGTQTNSYPAASTNAIAVAAMNADDTKAGFSQFGAFIDITAPGVSMLTSNNSGGYSTFSGTSGSTPVVAGCVGMVASGLGLNGKQALDVIFSTARNLGDPIYFGVGMPDLLKALDVLPTDPIPPPPPPPEPPPVPPTDSAIDLTPYLTFASSIPANEPKEGIANLTDGTNAKCLWFSKSVVLTAKFANAVSVSRIDLTSANDYPQRDPVWMRLKSNGVTVFEVSNIQFASRYQKISFPFTPSAAATEFTLELQSSGLQSSGGIITQLSELRLFGTSSTDIPPPPTPVDDPTLPLDDVTAIATLELSIPNLSPAKKLTLVSELNRLIGKAQA